MDVLAIQVSTLHPTMSSSPKMSLKLLIDKKGQRVLFAETTKEFVDFLFHIFSLPLGTLIEFLGSKQMVGCLGKLKESIHKINATYLQPGIKKENIFNPKTPFKGNIFLSYDTQTHLDVESASAAASKTIYRCCSVKIGYSVPPPCRSFATMHAGQKCPNCRCWMDVKMNHVVPKEEADAEVEAAAMKKIVMGGGFVKEVVSYMVMDDLVVKPMSTISSITHLITNFGVKDLRQLEEKTVSFGKDEALKLLKASLMTDNVLTTLFLLHNNA